MTAGMSLHTIPWPLYIFKVQLLHQCALQESVGQAPSDLLRDAQLSTCKIAGCLFLDNFGLKVKQSNKQAKIVPDECGSDVCLLQLVLL